MPGMAGVWRWRNWADAACCSLPGSQTVSVKPSLCVHLVVLHPAPSCCGPLLARPTPWRDARIVSVAGESLLDLCPQPSFSRRPF